MDAKVVGVIGALEAILSDLERLSHNPRHLDKRAAKVRIAEELRTVAELLESDTTEGGQ